MKPGQTCSTCGAYSAIANECRAKPPIVLFMGVSKEGAPMTLGAFPPCRKDNWCAEWRAEGQQAPAPSKTDSLVVVS